MMRPSKWRVILRSRPEAALAIFLLTALAWFAWNTARIQTYVFAALTLGVLLSLVVYAPPSTVSLSSSYRRVLSIGCYVGIAGMAILAHREPVGVPLAFYGLLVGVAGMLSVLIATAPHRRQLVPIVLFATTIRASYFYAAPVFGTDLRWHLAASQYVMETGEILPQSVSYYHFYPVGHVYTAIIDTLTGTSAKPSFFLAIGLATVVGIIVLGGLIPRLLTSLEHSNLRVVLYAALYLAIAPFHLWLSSVLIVQSLVLLFIPMAFYAFVSQDKRLNVVGLLAVGVAIITHNTPALVIAAFGTVLLLTNYAASKADITAIQPVSSINTVAAIVVGSISYWMVSNYLSLQVGRISRVFLPGDNLSQTTGSSIELAIPLLSPMFYTAVGLLFAGACFTATALIITRSLTRHKTTFPVDYYIPAGFVFAGLGVALLVALNTHVIRFAPIAPILAAPVVGYVLSRSSLLGRKGVVVVVLLILILPVSIFSSAAGSGFSVGDAVTEPRPGFYRLYLSHSELQGAQRSVSVTEELSANKYVTSALDLQRGVDNSVSGTEGIVVRRDGIPAECQTFYYREYYGSAFDIWPTSANDVVLDVGDAQLLTCR